MRAALRGLTHEYAAALTEYCAGRNEAALLRAHQIGRAAMAQGFNELEMAALHQESLVAAVLDRLGPEDGATITRRASEFFTESLSAFQMTRRGLTEANAIPQGLSLELTSRIEAVLRDYRDMQRQLEEQRRVRLLKNELVAAVSHELRTPLTSIHGALRLLKQGLGGELGPDAQRLLEVAHRNSERLVRMVNELDLETIQDRALTMDVHSFDGRGLLERAIEANLAYASKFGIELVLASAPFGARVRGDADCAMQLLTNLISNAVRFSPRGQVVELTAEPKGAAVRFAVIDHRPGVPAGVRSKFFQELAQADATTTRQKSRTGLGLSISKAIVERLGGEIGFHSEGGNGATFFFDLPAHPGAGERPAV